MKKQLLLTVVSASLISLGLVSTADAALIGRLAATPGGMDYQAYYDDAADLTWLADANYAVTSGYVAANVNIQGGTENIIYPEGRMDWQAANNWVAGLTVGGVSGWRLPDTIDVGNNGADWSNIYQGTDAGFNITVHSELSNMFYNVLGNTSRLDINGVATGCAIGTTFCLANTGPFSNFQPGDLGGLSAYYWSGTEDATNISNAWYFDVTNGWQSPIDKRAVNFAWAVQSGDISAVPVPAAVWLFGSGLLGLFGVARRKNANI